MAMVKQCWERTGKAPIDTRWVETNKGDDENPDVRCRWVAKEFNRNDGQDGLFAATPQLQVMKLLLSTLASGSKGERIMIADVKRAYFYAPVSREVYVELCSEDQADGGDGHVWKAQRVHVWH